MISSNSSRRDFLKTSAIAGAAASLAAISDGRAANAAPDESAAVTLPSGVVLKQGLGATRPRPDGQQPVHDLTTNPLERVRVGFIGCGGRGSSLVLSTTRNSTALRRPTPKHGSAMTTCRRCANASPTRSGANWPSGQKTPGHGGMDFVECYRHLSCIQKGMTPDIVVYDAAALSCMIEISSRSVAAGSMPVAIPDFTRGLWKKREPLGIVDKTA